MKIKAVPKLLSTLFVGGTAGQSAAVDFNGYFRAGPGDTRSNVAFDRKTSGTSFGALVEMWF